MSPLTDLVRRFVPDAGAPQAEEPWYTSPWVIVGGALLAWFLWSGRGK